ncbi:MAG: hypothetical protein AYK19_06480 [Theionarchaea archaeon DG-70-1]|nr:MAG: hypothetical protein AYK19_06480 [Theionarchaea archaeon DG-70-1]
MGEKEVNESSVSSTKPRVVPHLHVYYASAEDLQQRTKEVKSMEVVIPANPLRFVTCVVP